MALTAEDWREQLADDLGVAEDGAWVRRIRRLWDMNADRAIGGARLQFLYTKRACLDVELNGVREDVDYTEGDVSEKLSQLSGNLRALRDDVQAEIQLLEKRLQNSGGAAVGQLTTTTPLSGHPGRPDPNSRAYRGDPVVRRRYPY